MKELKTCMHLHFDIHMSVCSQILSCKFTYVFRNICYLSKCVCVCVIVLVLRRDFLYGKGGQKLIKCRNPYVYELVSAILITVTSGFTSLWVNNKADSMRSFSVGNAGISRLLTEQSFNKSRPLILWPFLYGLMLPISNQTCQDWWKAFSLGESSRRSGPDDDFSWRKLICLLNLIWLQEPKHPSSSVVSETVIAGSLGFRRYDS